MTASRVPPLDGVSTHFLNGSGAWSTPAGGTASSASALRWYDTIDYGAKSDLTRGAAATVTAGSATISGTTFSGSATDAGKLMRIQAAGAQIASGADGAMSNATIATKNQFTSAGANFTTAVVGRWIIITGQMTAKIIGVESSTQLRLATPASGTFTGASYTINEDHYTTIASSVTGVSATLTAAPLSSVTSAIVWYGTDDAPAIQAAVTDAELVAHLGGAGNLVYHFGASALGSPIYLAKPTQFVGAGNRGYSSLLSTGKSRLMLLKAAIRGIVAGGSDTGMGLNGSMTSGSAVLTDPNANFQAGDVGKQIIVYGAGTQVGSSVGYFLNTTISSRASATQVTLSASAGTTVSGAVYSYASTTGYTGGLVGPSVKNIHIVGGPGQLAGLHLMNSSDMIVEEVAASDFGTGVGIFIDPGPSTGFSNNMELRSCYAMDCRYGFKHDRGALLLTGQNFIDGNSNRVDTNVPEGMTIGVDGNSIRNSGSLSVQVMGTGVRSSGRGGGCNAVGDDFEFECTGVGFDLASDGTGGRHHQVGFTSMGSSNSGGGFGVRLRAGATATLRRGYHLDSDTNMFALVDPAATLNVLGERAEKAGTVGDSDFPNQPYDGAMGLDTSSGRVSFRIGGTWKYLATLGLASRARQIGGGAHISTATSISQTVPAGVTIPVGHHVILAVGYGKNSTLTVTASDTKSNTYQVDTHADMLTSNTPHALLISAPVTTQLVTGDVITVSFGGVAAGLADLLAYEYTGLPSSGWVDQAPSGVTGTSTTPASSAITTTQPNEVILSVLYNGGSPLATETPGAGWTLVGDQQDVGQKRLSVYEQATFATGTFTGTATLSASNDWAIVIASYKAA